MYFSKRDNVVLKKKKICFLVGVFFWNLSKSIVRIKMIFVDFIGE